MSQSVSILLVHNRSAAFESLNAELESRSLRAIRAQNCADARRLMDLTEPYVVFTDSELRDGTWMDVVMSATKSAKSMSVIVVSASADMGFYLKAVAWGAFDVVKPPLEVRRLEQLVRSAFADALVRRHADAHNRTERGLSKAA